MSDAVRHHTLCPNTGQQPAARSTDVRLAAAQVVKGWRILRRRWRCAGGRIYQLRGRRSSRGLAGFTVSPSQVARVKKYIERHKEHHRKISFKEESLELHKRSGVEFDERFLC